MRAELEMELEIELEVEPNVEANMCKWNLSWKKNKLGSRWAENS